ncbi:MAG: hypothetical protein ACYC8T_39175, partial [Myxococcaceae bacterium]
ACYSVAEHVSELVRYLGEDCLDYVLVSNTVPSEAALKAYGAKGQEPVVLRSREELARISKAELVEADIGHRIDLVRHDGQKVREVTEALLERMGTPVAAARTGSE